MMLNYAETHQKAGNTILANHPFTGERSIRWLEESCSCNLLCYRLGLIQVELEFPAQIHLKNPPQPIYVGIGHPSRVGVAYGRFGKLAYPNKKRFFSKKNIQKNLCVFRLNYTIPDESGKNGGVAKNI